MASPRFFDNDSNGSQQSLIAFTESNAAILFIATFNLLSAPRPIKNDRELAWLLRGVQEPVTRILIDANPINPESTSGTLLTIEEVLSQLKPEYSPWDYPIFAVGKEQGFLSIDGTGDDGEFLSAIAPVFLMRKRYPSTWNNPSKRAIYAGSTTRTKLGYFSAGSVIWSTRVALDPIVERRKTFGQVLFFD